MKHKVIFFTSICFEYCSHIIEPITIVVMTVAKGRRLFIFVINLSLNKHFAVFHCSYFGNTCSVSFVSTFAPNLHLRF